MIKNFYNKIFFYFYCLIAIIGMVALVFVFIFLYKNFYQTITQSEEILILRSEVFIEDINIDKLKKVVQKIEEKTKTRKWEVSNQ